MAEPIAYNLTEALHDNGFIDFYQMLGVTPDAPADEVRQRVNALYSEAQANRDHRNLNKRRDYQTLLELLPQARTALLETDKRQRYDDFAAQERSGTAGDFSSFIAALSGTVSDQDRTDVLGVKDGTATPIVRPRPPKPDAPVKPRQSQVKSSSQQSLTGSAIAVIVFVVALVLLHFAVSLRWEIALLIAAVAGVVAWFVTHSGGNKIAR